MSFSYYIGIDPGRKGALAVLNEAGELVLLTDACSTEELGVLSIEPVLLEYACKGQALVVVERPLAFPGVPAQDQITLALAAGAASGLARAHGASVMFPTASQWKRAMGVTSSKQSSKDKAAHIFGAGAIGRARHDKCEAALLAYWGFKKTNDLS